MNTDHLKYLIAISKTKSMSRASESLFISPQALSMAIRKLEDDLSMPLLKRSSSGTELTENGRWLVDLASQFFNDIATRQSLYQVFQNSGLSPHSEGVLHILLNASGIGESQLADIICAINQQEPDFTIDFREAPRHEVEQAVKNNDIELGFIYRTKYNKKYIDELDDPLVFYPLSKGTLTVMAHDKYPFAKFDSTYLKKIVDYPICSYNAIDDINRLPNLLHMVTNKPIDYTSTNNYSLYRANVISGSSIAVTIKFSDQFVFNQVKEVNTINIRDDIEVYFGAVRRKEEMLTESASFFWHTLMSAYESDTP